MSHGVNVMTQSPQNTSILPVGAITICRLSPIKHVGVNLCHFCVILLFSMAFCGMFSGEREKGLKKGPLFKADWLS